MPILYACRIVVPWPLISPTFPRRPSKLLDLPTSLPPPPSPTLSWIFTSPQPPSSSSSHFIAIFSLFPSFGNLFFPPIPPSIASSFHPLSLAASLFQYTNLSISSFPRSWTPDCATVLQTACESIRACQRTPRRPI